VPTHESRKLTLGGEKYGATSSLLGSDGHAEIRSEFLLSANVPEDLVPLRTNHAARRPSRRRIR